KASAQAPISLLSLTSALNSSCFPSNSLDTTSLVLALVLGKKEINLSGIVNKSYSAKASNTERKLTFGLVTTALKACSAFLAGNKGSSWLLSKTISSNSGEVFSRKIRITSACCLFLLASARGKTISAKKFNSVFLPSAILSLIFFDLESLSQSSLKPSLCPAILCSKSKTAVSLELSDSHPSSLVILAISLRIPASKLSFSAVP